MLYWYSRISPNWKSSFTPIATATLSRLLASASVAKIKKRAVQSLFVIISIRVSFQDTIPTTDGARMKRMSLNRCWVDQIACSSLRKGHGKLLKSVYSIKCFKIIGVRFLFPPGRLVERQRWILLQLRRSLSPRFVKQRQNRVESLRVLGRSRGTGKLSHHL